MNEHTGWGFVCRPLLLVSTLDGAIHAMDARTGDPVWSFSTGTPLLQSSLVQDVSAFAREDKPSGSSSASRPDGPPATTSHLDWEHDHHAFGVYTAVPAPELASDSPSNPGSDIVAVNHTESFHDSVSRVAVIPSVDGSLYFGRVAPQTGQAEIERLPLTARDIVDASPFQTADGSRFIASKETHVLLINRHSGLVKQVRSGRDFRCNYVVHRIANPIIVVSGRTFCR